MATMGDEVLLRRRRDDRLLETLAGGSTVKAIGGAAAVALAIIGLANVFPPLLLSIAMIAVGVAFLFEGGAISARFTRILPRTEGFVPVELGGGMTAEFTAGAAGITLGILSLIGIVPAVLAPVSAIVFGGALILGSSVPSRLQAADIAGVADPRTHQMLREAGYAATGTNVLVGAGSIVLGILALAGIGPTMILSLVALLAVGFTVLLSGTAVSTKVMNVLRH